MTSDRFTADKTTIRAELERRARVRRTGTCYYPADCRTQLGVIRDVLDRAGIGFFAKVGDPGERPRGSLP